jgi:hypothetical protein
VGAVLAAIGLHRLSGLISARRFSILLAVMMLVQITALLVPDQYGRPVLSNCFGDRLAAVLGLETADAHLERNVQSYSMFKYINSHLPPREPLAMIWENRGYYLDHPYLADSFFEASTIMGLAAQAGTPSGLARRLEVMGYRYVVVNDFLGDFFSRYYRPETVQVLEYFVRDHLKPIHSANGLVLYTMH